MSFSDHTLIKLELTFEGMRAQVGHLLTTQQSELQSIVDNEIERMKNNTEALLREQVRLTVAQAIKAAVEAQRYNIQRIIQPQIENALKSLAVNGLVDE